MSDDDLILVERHEGLLLLTLNRPEQRNPIDHATVRRLQDLLSNADANSDVTAVVLTGADPAFSAGGDLRGYLTLYRDEPQFRSFLRDFTAVNALLERGRFVSVAMVNGACVAGGLELLLSCDLSVAADDAKIGDGHARSGQLPGAGGSQRLWRAVGTVRAKDLLLTGRLVDGTEAAAMGLVTMSVPPAELRDHTLELARQVASNSPIVIAKMKELQAIAETHELNHGIALEHDVVVDYATTSHDALEGLHSFLERRPPEWRGQ
jgi:enoyl-CoA hydratase/carnithine racemase